MSRYVYSTINLRVRFLDFTNVVEQSIVVQKLLRFGSQLTIPTPQVPSISLGTRVYQRMSQYVVITDGNLFVIVNIF